MTPLSTILSRRSAVLNLFSPDQSAAEAVETMCSRGVGAVLILEDDRLAGIFSERDLLRRVVSAGRPLDATPLRDVMTPDPLTAKPEDARYSAILKMAAVGCRHLPIVKEGRVVDTVSIRDLLFDEIDEKNSEIEELRRYISGR